MSDPGCTRGHVWVTYTGSKVNICKNCGADRPAFQLPYNDPINVEKRHAGLSVEPKTATDVIQVYDAIMDLCALLESLDRKTEVEVCNLVHAQSMRHLFPPGGLGQAVLKAIGEGNNCA